MFQAMAHAYLGEMEEAAEVVSRLQAQFPSFTVEGFIAGYPISNPPALSAVREGARLARLV